MVQGLKPWSVYSKTVTTVLSVQFWTFKFVLNSGQSDRQDKDYPTLPKELFC